MKKLFLNFLLSIIFSTTAFAQQNNYSVPVKWEKYKNSNEKIELLFPKLPVKSEYTDWCKQTVIIHYYAYTDEVVYDFRIFQKSNNEIPVYCYEKEKFTKESFTNRITALQSKETFGKPESVQREKNTFIKLSKNEEGFKSSIYLLNDYEKKRWFEFTISSDSGKQTNENNFIDSLNFGTAVNSIEINDGAERVFGDENISLEMPTELEKDKTVEEKVTPIRIVLKPKPKYTDEARQSNTVGNVRLRVSFFRNGAIGSVTVIAGLENGLTEQAVNSAKKIAFLPMKRNGESINVTRVVVYTFSIY
jgi:hypothetical protein